MNDIMKSLHIELHGSSGIEIRALLKKEYNCVEFTLNSNPQPIFISPWMQFEPAEMAHERAQIAHEIVNRAINYQNLLDKVTSLERQLEASRNYSDRLIEQRYITWEMWKNEREKCGLPRDFSDIKEWPKEMLSDYV